MRKAIVTVVAFCCITVGAMLASHPALAAEAGDAQRKVAVQAAPAPQPKAADFTTLGERVIALEKENVVLREDLGKARLDLRTGLANQAKETTQLQEKVNELNAALAAEREKQSKRSRNMWIALGLLALGVVASS